VNIWTAASRLEGKPRLRFSIVWLANNLGVSARRVREAVRRLVEKGVLRLIARLLAVQTLVAGKLRPQVFNAEDAGSERSGLKPKEVGGGEKRGPACHRSPSAEPKTEKR
jgi:hypothetical protein